MRIYLCFLTFFLTNFYYSFDLRQTRNDFYLKSDQKLENAYVLRDYFLDESPDSIFNLGTHLIRNGIKTENLAWLHYGKLLTASYFNKKNKTDLSIEYLKECINYYTRKRDYLLLSDAYNILAQANLLNGKYQLASDYAKKSIDLSNQLPDEEEAFVAYLTLTEIYLAQEKFDLAEKQITIFLSKAKHLNLNKALRKGYGLLATICMNTNRTSEGLALYDKALNLAFENGDKMGLATAYNNSAIAYFGNDDIEKTKLYFEKALKLRLQINYPKTICESYYNLVELHHYLNQIEKANHYLNLLIGLSEKHQLINEQVDAYEKAMVLYEKDKEKSLIFARKLINAQQKQLRNSFQSNIEIQNTYQLNTQEESVMLQKIREQMLQSRIEQLEQRQWLLLLGFSALIITTFVLIWRLRRN
jgi:hypothetical protein